MNFARRLTATAAALALAAWFVSPHVQARQAAPGAPSNLTYLLNGIDLSVYWTHATGAFTHYVVDVALGPGQPPIVEFSTAQFVDPSKLPQMLASLRNPVAPLGTYYVKIHGANGAVVGPASPEIAITIPGGCVAPGAPTNLTGIVRGSSAWIQWNAGTGGVPAAYVLQASYGSGANFDGQFLGAAAFGTPSFNVGLPPGTFYLRAYSANACGTSGYSNEIAVTAGADTPATTPNPVAGDRLPQPDVRALVFALAQQAAARGYLAPDVACPTRAGSFSDPLEARKTQRNPYIDYIVENLRAIDQRFGYNAKPTRAWVPSIIAGDEIAYHYGTDAPEGSPNVYLVDVLGGHCTGVGVVGNTDTGPNRLNPDYRAFYNEFGTWTGAGRF